MTATITKHKVALTFEDGVTRFIECEEGQTVADASYRARINIPLDCRDGACGTCKSHCESGDYDPGYYIDDALTDDEAEQGYCLPCQMKPKSDLVLQIPSTSAVAKTQAASYKATVAELERLSSTVFRLVLDVEGWENLSFLAGQYVNIAVPGTDQTRSYSFANGVNDGIAEFFIKNTPGGVMSTYLDERAEVGDTLTVTGPNGSFFLRESDQPVLLLAGGTGLAPVMSMLRTLEGLGSRRPVHVLYGATTDEDVVQLDTLTQLHDSMPQMSWDYVVGDPKSTAKLKGFTTDHISDDVLYDGAVSVYVCGPPPMVEGARKHFADRGVNLAGFYFEKFALAGAAGDTSTAKAAEPTGEQLEDAGIVGTEEETEAEQTVKAPAPVYSEAMPVDSGVRGLFTDPEARSICRQPIFVRSDDEMAPVAELDFTAVTVEDDDRRGVARQAIFASSPLTEASQAATAEGDVAANDETLILATEARGVARQEIFGQHDLEPLVEPTPEAPTPVAGFEPFGGDVASGGYQIGEEIPGGASSDAVFEAREALEMGALELVIGRANAQQLSGFRLLAEATTQHVDGDTFVDVDAFVETNGAFHDYLFTLTGNTHLLEAYQRLGVRGHMDQTLHGATWCHPRICRDHLDFVTCLEQGDRDGARAIIQVHTERAKMTMRRAMVESASGPTWVSAGRFAGQVVVVTGSAQGIGETVARRIGAEGGLLVLADRSELVERVAADIGRRGPGKAVTVTADLETYAGAQAVIDAAMQKYGRVDVAIHNVGGAIKFKPFTEFTSEQIDAEISRSLMPTLYGCHAVLPHMIGAGGGTIVNVSSIATGGIYRIPYAAAKGGVNAITRALAVEAAEYGVRVVASAPGGTEAPPRKIARGPAPEGEQEQEWFQAHIDQTLDSALLHRYGTLDEQAAAICFLASREAAYITGSVLPVGGGDLG